jgi:hypothetical protein
MAASFQILGLIAFAFAGNVGGWMLEQPCRC